MYDTLALWFYGVCWISTRFVHGNRAGWGVWESWKWKNGVWLNFLSCTDIVLFVDETTRLHLNIEIYCSVSILNMEYMTHQIIIGKTTTNHIASLVIVLFLITFLQSGECIPIFVT